jgi:hypothetical protein
MKTLFASILSSMQRCKRWILVIAVIYCLSCLTGIILVHKDNSFSLSYRDQIVENAVSQDKASINYNSGNRFNAALIDFGGNLSGSVIQTITGLSVVIPFLMVSYQGWIGGIVSIDGNHQSRLNKIKSAMYYFIVLVLQYIPYSLTIGSGIRLGIETYRINKSNSLFQYRIDKTGIRDVLNMYILAIPLFFIASCFEFLSPWNI